MDRPNYITPAGYAVLSAEYRQLLGEERPKLVDVISWAAGNAIAARMATISMVASGCARSTVAPHSLRGG